MMHPDTELRFIDDRIGYGVFATRLIPKGTIVWALDTLDQRLTNEQVEQMIEPMKCQVLKYSYRNELGEYILCWDIARYINHSFYANCVGTAYGIELAARDIAAGEQLTDDYGTLNVDEPFHCIPELHSERTIVMPDDLLNYYQIWDQLAYEAFQHFHDVNQPLEALVKPQFMEKIRLFTNGLSEMDSIKNIYFNRRNQ